MPLGTSLVQIEIEEVHTVFHMHIHVPTDKSTLTSSHHRPLLANPIVKIVNAHTKYRLSVLIANVNKPAMKTEILSTRQYSILGGH